MTHSKPLGTVFTYKNLIKAISGSVGSVIAMTTFYPLDTIRYRQQLNQFPKECDRLNALQMIWYLTTKEGLAAMYRGLFPVLESLCISNFVYFYTFHCLKSSVNLKESSATLDLLFGMLAGVVNVLGTTPCWVVNTRLKMVATQSGTSLNQKVVNYNNLLEGLIYVGKTEGRKGLWAGTVPSLMLVINPAIQFMVYEGLKRRVLRSQKSISGWGVFGIGAVAKAVATILTYPLQLVQTKLRHGSHHKENGENVGVLQMILVELKRNGVKGLFRGIEAKLLQTVLTAALMFLTYEKISRFVFTILRANKQ